MKRALLLIGATALVIMASAELEVVANWAEGLPVEFQKQFVHIAIWQWIGLLAIGGISMLAGYVGKRIGKNLAKLRDRFSPQPMQQTTRDGVARGFSFLAASLMALMLLPDLKLQGNIGTTLDLLMQALVITSVVIVIYAGWDAFCDSLMSRTAGHERAERLLVPMTRKFVQALIVIGGALVALAVFFGPKTITGLIAGLGVGGLVVALAAKDSVENLFGSFTILFDMPFALGDWVKIDKVEGVVEEINLRSTRVRTFEDTLITLPNANLIRAAVENYGARRSRRQKLWLRISYDTKPEAIDGFCTDIVKYLESQENVVQGKSIAELNDPLETSIGVLIQCFFEVTTADQENHMRHQLLQESLRLKDVHDVIFLSPIKPPVPAVTATNELQK